MPGPPPASIGAQVQALGAGTGVGGPEDRRLWLVLVQGLQACWRPWPPKPAASTCVRVWVGACYACVHVGVGPAN